jgi:hypothetical protein
MQRTGRPPSPDSRAKYLATREAIAPPKQLELIEKRSSWVFATVGTIGAALGGFTLLLTRAFKTKVWELSVIYSHA